LILLTVQGDNRWHPNLIGKNTQTRKTKTPEGDLWEQASSEKGGMRCRREGH